MLAHGRLWMPALPLPDFFDTFYVLVRPVYAAQSFPGAALLNVPGVWLGLQSWVMPLVVASVCVGLVYWIITELIDGAAGLMSVILLLSLTMFRMTALMVLAQIPVLMLGLAATWCWLHLRNTGRYGWAAALGAASGWAAITRPLDWRALLRRPDRHRDAAGPETDSSATAMANARDRRPGCISVPCSTTGVRSRRDGPLAANTIFLLQRAARCQV